MVAGTGTNPWCSFADVARLKSGHKGSFAGLSMGVGSQTGYCDVVKGAAGRKSSGLGRLWTGRDCEYV